jgi:hypothetical protein
MTTVATPAKGLRNAAEFWKLHWLADPGKRSLLSLPHYYPKGSDVLKEIADKAVSEIAGASSGAVSRTAFRLLDAVQQTLQARGLYGDVLEADAACLSTERPNALFIAHWTQDLDHPARTAFGLQQAEAM